MALPKLTDCPPLTVAPTVSPIESVTALPGLSGSSWRRETPGGPQVERVAVTTEEQQRLSRHYRVLQRLPDGVGPRPLSFRRSALVHRWLEGDSGQLPEMSELAVLLARLHRGQLFGWRIEIESLIARYWNEAAPERRSFYWLRCWRHLRRQGLPTPLRVAPLHMDVHAGNLVATTAGWRLIDWEYAGDGDIALELAAADLSPAQRRQLVAAYAPLAHLSAERLAWQVKRWRPWVNILVLAWFEWRWQQTQAPQFKAWADAGWRDLEFTAR